jgi:hypothetical protein
LTEAVPCEVCGSLIPPRDPTIGGPVRKLCSARCRSKSSRDNRRKDRPPRGPCLECGEVISPFSGMGKNAKFCSRRCKAMHMAEHGPAKELPAYPRDDFNTPMRRSYDIHNGAVVFRPRRKCSCGEQLPRWIKTTAIRPERCLACSWPPCPGVGAGERHDHR